LSKRTIRSYLDVLYYYWKRNNWIIDPRTYLGEHDHITIDRPIFLLGFQGGGLTLVSRMLRRNPAVVSVTGNCRYWSGADEMHTVLGPLLPAELTGTRYKVPCAHHPFYLPPRSWTYACDELLPYYRKTEADATAELKHRFQRLIRLVLARHAPGDASPRFTDKSQVYTVRVSLIRELLKEHKPKFLLIAMNPYAACRKAANGKAIDMKRLRQKLPFETRLNICAQHWANSIACALRDAGGDFSIIRFEDVLADPKGSMNKICGLLELEFDEIMLPQEGQVLPLGSRFRNRWYPLDCDRNQAYLRNIDSREIRIINSTCGELIRRLGYDVL
jgi:hypothetical protein